MKPGDLVAVRTEQGQLGVIITVSASTARVLVNGEAKWVHKAWLEPVNEAG
jgi:hypothetical protein